MQYRAELGSSDPSQTSTLSDVSIAYTTGADTTAPTITQRTPAPNATNVPRNTNVDVQFSEPMNPATINGSTVGLRKQGAGSDVPASVSYAGNTATIDPNADLDPSAVYDVTVKGGASGVTDAAGNPLAADDTWSFTTVPLTLRRHHHRRLQRRHPRRQHLRLRDRQRRGDPEADRRGGVLGELGAGRLDELPVDHLRAALPGPARPSRVAACTLDGAYARRTTATPRAARSSSGRPSTRSARDRTRLRHGPERRANGRPSASSPTATPSLRAPTTDSRAGQQETSWARGLLGSPHLFRIEWGTSRRQVTTWTAAWSRPTPSNFARTDAR